MYNVYAEFPRQKVCRDRQNLGLTRWAAYILAQAIPATKPDEAFVEQRIIASRIYDQTENYVNLTIQYTLADPAIQTNVRQHLSAYNDESTEVSMDAQVDGAIGTYMPGFCRGKVSQQEIDNWYVENGFTVTATQGQRI
jgi:hypothetical protein